MRYQLRHIRVARISACRETLTDTPIDSQTERTRDTIARRCANARRGRLVSSPRSERFGPSFGRLAQLVARFLHTEEVVGSSPASPTNAPTPLGAFVVHRRTPLWHPQRPPTLTPVPARVSRRQPAPARCRSSSSAVGTQRRPAASTESCSGGRSMSDPAAMGAIDGVGVPAGVHGGDEGAAPSVFFRVDDLDAAVVALRAASTATPLNAIGEPLLRSAPAVPVTECAGDARVPGGVERRGFPSHSAAAHSEHAVDSRPAGTTGGIPGAVAQCHVVAIAVVRPARQLDREEVTVSGRRDDRHGTILASSVPLLVRHPGPHDLTGVGIAVSRRGVRQAHALES